MAVGGTISRFGYNKELMYMKGSIEAVLERCSYYYIRDDSTPAMDSATRALILSKATDAGKRGLRVIAMAYGYGALDILDKKVSSLDTPSSEAGSSGNLIFTGFEAMMDPPRKGVADAVAALQAGGVHVVMVTGDAEETALSIARQLGLRVQPGGASCLTGAAIDGMGEAQLRERVGSVSVFARTTPRHKMAIVDAFRSRGAVVAMTGDGGECSSERNGYADADEARRSE